MFPELINKLNFLDETEKELATVNSNPFDEPDGTSLNPFGDPDSEGSKFFCTFEVFITLSSLKLQRHEKIFLKKSKHIFIYSYIIVFSCIDPQLKAASTKLFSN